MKKKIMTHTYLRDVSQYRVKLFMDIEDCYISVKKLVKVDIPFVIHGNVTVMDDDFYVLEVVPKNENYAMRLFLNDKKEALEYYFDICKNNRLDSNKIPCYDDLYLDITYLDGKINILDEKELLEAYKFGDINQEDYDLVYIMKEKLLDEIKNKTNEMMNVDYMKYLNDF